MMKKIILLSVLINYSVISAVSWSNGPQYENAALNSAHQAIQQRAINLSTSEVAGRAGTERDVAQCFEEEFLTDVAENAPISEKRKMQRTMTLVRAAHQAQPVSGLTLEVNDLVETVSLDFQNKEESLVREKEGLWSAKIGWGTLMVISLGVGLCATQMRGNGQMIAGGVGVGATMLGGAKFYSTIGKEGKLKIHIARVQTMKNGWENSFRVK